jgi:hypothetical protein
MTDNDPADWLISALAVAQQSGNPVPGGDLTRWRRIIRITLHRWRTFPRRHPGAAADTLSCRTEDLARGLLDRCGRYPGQDGPPDITDYRDLAAQLAAVLRTFPALR